MQVRLKIYFFIVGVSLSFYLQTSVGLPKIDVKKVIENNKMQSEQSLLNLAKHYKDKQMQEMVKASIAQKELTSLNQEIVTKQNSICFLEKSIQDQSQIKFDSNYSSSTDTPKDFARKKIFFESNQQIYRDELIGQIEATNSVLAVLIGRVNYLVFSMKNYTLQADQFDQLAGAYSETLDVKKQEFELDQMNQEDCISTAQEKVIRHQKKQAEARSFLVNKSLQAQNTLDQQEQARIVEFAEKEKRRLQAVARKEKQQKEAEEKSLQLQAQRLQKEQARAAELIASQQRILEEQEKIAEEQKRAEEERALLEIKVQEERRIKIAADKKKADKKKVKQEKKCIEKEKLQAEKVLRHENAIKIQALFRGRSARQGLVRKLSSQLEPLAEVKSLPSDISPNSEIVKREKVLNIFIQPEIMLYEDFLEKIKFVQAKRKKIEKKLQKNEKKEAERSRVLEKFDRDEGYKAISDLLTEYIEVICVDNFDLNQKKILGQIIYKLAKINQILCQEKMPISYFLLLSPDINQKLTDRYTQLISEIQNLEEDIEIQGHMAKKEALHRNFVALEKLISDTDTDAKESLKLLKKAKTEANKDDLVLYQNKAREVLTLSKSMAIEKKRIEEQLVIHDTCLKLLTDKINLYGFIEPLHIPGGILHTQDIKLDGPSQESQLGNDYINNSFVQMFFDLAPIVENVKVSENKAYAQYQMKKTIQLKVIELLNEVGIKEDDSIKFSKQMVINSSEFAQKHLAGIIDLVGIQRNIYRDFASYNEVNNFGYTEGQINDFVALQIKLIQLVAFYYFENPSLYEK